MTKGILLGIVYITLSISLWANPNSPYEVFYEESDFESQIELLRVEFGKNKDIPEQVELAALVALSMYPELKETKIEFIFRDQQELMLMRPKSHITLRKKENRIFRILMTNNEDKCRGITIEEIPFNALVGVFGHELGHVLDFKSKSSIDYVSESLKYTLSKKYRASVERQTDIVTVEHGLGYQLCHIRDVLAQCEFMPRARKGKSLSAYLTRDEILHKIKEQEK